MGRWDGRDLTSRARNIVVASTVATLSLCAISSLPAGATTTSAALQQELVQPGAPWVPAPATAVAELHLDTTATGGVAASKLYQSTDGTVLLVGLAQASGAAATVTSDETTFINHFCVGANDDQAVSGLNEGVSTACQTTTGSGASQPINVVVGSNGSTIIFAISTGPHGPASIAALTSVAKAQYQAMPKSLFTVINIAIVALLLIAILLIVMIVRAKIKKGAKGYDHSPDYDSVAYETDGVFVGASVKPVEAAPVAVGRAHGSADSLAYVANPPPGLGTYPEFGVTKKPEGPEPLPSFHNRKPSFGHTPDARARMVGSTATIQRVEPQAPPRSPTASPLAVGWHEDPTHPHVQNYWDGSSWTKQTQWDGSNWITSA